jgi:hypothetical protein
MVEETCRSLLRRGGHSCCLLLTYPGLFIAHIHPRRFEAQPTPSRVQVEYKSSFPSCHISSFLCFVSSTIWSITDTLERCTA